MSGKKQKTLVPRLRFPEFRDAGEWEVKRLGELCEMEAGKFIAASEILENPAEGLYQCFGGNGLRGYTKNFNHSGRYPLIGRQGALCGNVTYAKGDFYATEHAVVAAPKPGSSVDWLFYNLCFLNLNRFATGQAQPGLSVEILEKVVCTVPSDEKEQQKIADCLSSLDELIALEAQKGEALKAHKKGLMQQLFPTEGETTPRLRFPEFRDAGEWEVKTIGKVCESFSGGTPTTTLKGYYGGSIPFIRSAEIGAKTTELFLTEDGLKNSAAKMVCKGDVLVALYGANSGDVAISRLDGAINQAVLCLRSSGSNEFIYHYLSEKKEWIISTYIQGGQGNLSGEIIKSVKIGFPTLPEQLKIAACLSSLDELIEAQAQKVDALKRLKKGLMQQLFPQEVD